MIKRILLSTLVTSVSWPIVEMLIVAISGSDAAKGINGLQFLAVIFNLPIILGVCIATTIVISRIASMKNKDYLYYLIPTPVIMGIFRTFFS
jgi:hypothetical protein